MYLRDFLFINLGHNKLYIKINCKCSNLHKRKKIIEIIMKVAYHYVAVCLTMDKNKKN